MARMSAVHRADAEARQRMVAVLEASLGRQPGLAFAVVFGSFVEGRDVRDVDLEVWTTASAGPRIDLELATALSQELAATDSSRTPTRRTSRATDCSSPSKPHWRSVTTCPPGA
jgi:predicted nucleotidyltransferase